jgi:hypothetical protein
MTMLILMMIIYIQKQVPHDPPPVRAGGIDALLDVLCNIKKFGLFKNRKLY